MFRHFFVSVSLQCACYDFYIFDIFHFFILLLLYILKSRISSKPVIEITCRKKAICGNVFITKRWRREWNGLFERRNFISLKKCVCGWGVEWMERLFLSKRPPSANGSNKKNIRIFDNKDKHNVDINMWYEQITTTICTTANDHLVHPPGPHYNSALYYCILAERRTPNKTILPIISGL